MPEAALIEHIEQRLALAGLATPAGLSTSLAAYVDVLARWNSRINLTAYSLERPSDEAIDRLIVEPVAMARFVTPDDRMTIDVGSGGGSPAFPFRLAAPRLRQVLVESRLRKAAFLREAARVLGLRDVTVENRRLEELAKAPEKLSADIVTMRAVRADEALCEAVRTLLRPGGRLFWLTSERSLDLAFPGLAKKSVHPLITSSSARLVVNVKV